MRVRSARTASTGPGSGPACASVTGGDVARASSRAGVAVLATVTTALTRCPSSRASQPGWVANTVSPVAVAAPSAVATPRVTATPWEASCSPCSERDV